MNNEKFLTCLLMTVFGIILWVFVGVAIIMAGRGMISHPKLEKEGKETVAEVWNIIYNREENIYNYYVKYTIDGKEYRDEFKTKDNSVKEGEKIIVYYLQGEENKIYLSKESDISKSIFVYIFYIIILLPIAYFGKKCITNYNVFKYKRAIDVE